MGCSWWISFITVSVFLIKKAPSGFILLKIKVSFVCGKRLREVHWKEHTSNRTNR
jgi:hypothetical protein